MAETKLEKISLAQVRPGMLLFLAYNIGWYFTVTALVLDVFEDGSISAVLFHDADAILDHSIKHDFDLKGFDRIRVWKKQ